MNYLPRKLYPNIYIGYYITTNIRLSLKLYLQKAVTLNAKYLKFVTNFKYTCYVFKLKSQNSHVFFLNLGNYYLLLITPIKTLNN